MGYGPFDDYLDMLQAVRDVANTELEDLVEDGGWNRLAMGLCQAIVGATDAYLAYAGPQHPQMVVELSDGRVIEVDERIARLVAFLNEQPGIRTFASCQGGEQFGPGGAHFDAPYVALICETPAARVWLEQRFTVSEPDVRTQPGEVVIRGDQVLRWRNEHESG